MSIEQLSAVCGFLVLLLAGSEVFPFMRTIKANSWMQLILAVLKAIASQSKAKR